MRLVNSSKLLELQKRPHNIRNICILAHVDHGKTTLADSLVANNGIISAKMAGKLRYMDSREDEQERGITMKSSSIALYYMSNGEEYLINLIDSPGHVDFSSEVSTAVRLCDGAIVLIDVIEGVCPQTRVALQQAWSEGLKPVLVLNKIDRLIIERGLTALDAYVHLSQVLEQVNAVMGGMFATDVYAKDDAKVQSEPKARISESDTYDWSTGLEDSDDSNLYFCPEKGNVVFACAVDGWAFGVSDFAKVYSEKMGIKKELLQKVLWGDFYLNSKTKRFMKGAQEKAKKPVFVQFVLDNIWALYDTIAIRKDREKIPGIVEKLGIKLTARDLRHTDPKVQLQAVCSQWLPLARSVLDMVCSKLPSPKEITPEKVEHLMCSHMQRFDSLPAKTQALKDDFLACDNTIARPLIVSISKMFSVDRSVLPCNKARVFSLEEMSARRDMARQRHAERMAVNDANKNSEDNVIHHTALSLSQVVITKEEEPEEDAKELPEDVFIAFARVFSGTIKVGQEVYVLGPKHIPGCIEEDDIESGVTLKHLKGDQHVTRATIKNLYLLMGRELEELTEVPAGNVIGIGGLEEHVLKTATLSSTVHCPSFTEVQMLDPIVRVAVEPLSPLDMPALVRGLRLLNQADACVQVLLQGSGEHVLATAGEVHLERCLEDLKLRYAKVPIKVSEPIVPFRETVVPIPIMDMVNEAIQDQGKNEGSEPAETTIEMWTANRQSCIKIVAKPMPTQVTEILEKNAHLLKTMDNYTNKKYQLGKTNGCITFDLTERTLKAIRDLRNDLVEAFKTSDQTEYSDDIVDKIWSAGPRKYGPNLLINNTGSYRRPSFWSLVLEESEIASGEKDMRADYDSTFVNGFQMAALAGPLCEEPLQGVCFFVEEWLLNEDDSIGGSQPYGPFSGQIMSCVKESCRRAFQAQPQRLVAAMYSCNIMVNAEVLGKMYAVLGRRHGRILAGDQTQGSGYFCVTAVLPVVESFAFANEMRKQTSGLASPQLFFSHWEIIDIDPFWTPSTEEEYLHYGEKADSANRARRYVDAVRKRKGLSVDEKLVEFAEKQRTLSRKK